MRYSSILVSSLFALSAGIWLAMQDWADRGIRSVELPITIEQIAGSASDGMPKPAPNQAEYPEATADFLLGLQKDGKEADLKDMPTYLSNLACLWVRQSPQSAADWSQQIPEGPAKDLFILQLSGTWIHTDPLAASAWIKTLTSSPGKDTAVTNLIYKVVQSDPQSAVAWATQIQDEATRSDGLQSCLQVLLKKYPDEGKQAIQAAPLSQEIISGALGVLAKTNPLEALQYTSNIQNETIRRESLQTICAATAPASPAKAAS